MATTTTTEFGTTRVYEIGQRVEARGIGGRIIVGTVTDVKASIYSTPAVEVHWDHLGYTNWEIDDDLRPAAAAEVDVVAADRIVASRGAEVIAEARRVTQKRYNGLTGAQHEVPVWLVNIVAAEGNLAAINDGPQAVTLVTAVLAAL